MRRCEPGFVLEPADEGLRVGDPSTHVDRPREPPLVQPPAGLGIARDVRGSPPPRRRRGCVEAHLLDHRPRGVCVGRELAAGSERVDEHAPSVGQVEQLAQVDVPVALPGPGDLLSGLDDVADANERVDVLVAEVRDVDQPAHAVRCGVRDLASFDRVHAVRAPGRRATAGQVVTDGDVDAVVVDGAELVVSARVEEGAADRVLAVERQHRPPPPLVVVALSDLEPSWNTRHSRRSSLSSVAVRTLGSPEQMFATSSREVDRARAAARIRSGACWS